MLAEAPRLVAAVVAIASIYVCEPIDLVYSSLTTSQVASTIIYRLTLHPLAKYPGPFLGKVTAWYDTYHAWKKDRHLDQQRCQQRYGMSFSRHVCRKH